MIYHKHHLVPRYMGGSDEPSNLVKCNIAMHAFFHKMLYEQYGNWEDKSAYEALSGQITHQDAWIKAGQNTRRGKPCSEEHKAKIRAAKLGKKLSPEHIANAIKGRASTGIHKPFLGKKHSDETKKLLSKQKIGNKICLGRVVSKKTRDRISETRKTMFIEGKL